MNVLVINGHPNLDKSFANAEILKLFAQHTDWQLAHTADFAGDIATEQQRLLAADLVIVQFPLYWSTFPSVMKEWIDQVFTYGFAFGPDGSQLKGKKLLFSITAGATAQSYSESGFNFMPLEQYQRAFEHAFKAAEMHILDTVVTFEMNAIPEEGGDAEQTIALAHEHANKIINLVNAHIG
ncbi:NAD(P)H dehydrogenase (quinone) [Vibrio ichthyoenteri ATCC 700023]|uniref:NAD(P)H dehydrogenase (Quinone) n=1 Tax=Vibrio ichthyoenteri ATCC 700023 TaxID=870968 RepID=F9S572_9VIBR|nr:NAD(P)H-dependent oxidoreductase [Vibrio ichthyoenteri]EGU35938.1 NAD(P)H dehydrogenase (quinone) [Vibrio ichthyoenteri ATCC 700023]